MSRCKEKVASHFVPTLLYIYCHMTSVYKQISGKIPGFLGNIYTYISHKSDCNFRLLSNEYIKYILIIQIRHLVDV